jgi:hypothetical protein
MSSISHEPSRAVVPEKHPSLSQSLVPEMWLTKRITSRRQRKAHERFLQERERQQMLQEQDVEKAVRERTTWAGGNQQGGQ